MFIELRTKDAQLTQTEKKHLKKIQHAFLVKTLNKLEMKGISSCVKEASAKTTELWRVEVFP